MTDRFDRIARLDAALHFCEDFDASAPRDRAWPTAAGPLSDKIIGVKANISVAGQSWTAGIGSRADRTAQADAPVIAALRSAGALLLSRLVMDEGAFGATADNPNFGRCENPTYPGHSAGGSSGGSAAAVAAGAADAALGTDTMGSVRIPAAYCGVYGLKLGAGAVDMTGIMPLAPSLDSLGVLASTPAMIGQVLDAIAPGEGGPEIAGWRAPDDRALAQCAPEVCDAVEAASRRLQRVLGPPDPMPELDLPALRSDAFLLTEAEAVASFALETGLSDGLQKLIAYGRALTAERLHGVRSRLGAANRALIGSLGQNGVLLLPTVAAAAFAHGMRPPTGQADLTAIANIAGLPALAIPVEGATPPISIQLVGPPNSERALLELAERI